MTLLYPPRQTNVSTGSFLRNSCYNVKGSERQQRVPEVSRFAYSSPYEQLSCRFEKLAVNREIARPRRFPERVATSCSDFPSLRSILKKRTVLEINLEIDTSKNITNVSTYTLTKSGSTTDAACQTSYNSVKCVTFADDNNRDLVEVRTFVSHTFSNTSVLSTSPELCNNFLPASPELCTNFLPAKREDLRFKPTTPESANGHRNIELQLFFKEPYLKDSFEKKLSGENVSLEKCGIRNRLITGLVLVKNISYEKQVFVRYTISKWKTFSNTDAIYLSMATDGLHDRFMFTLTVPNRADDLEFAICFKTPTDEYWDNNDKANYKVGYQPL